MAHARRRRLVYSQIQSDYTVASHGIRQRGRVRARGTIALSVEAVAVRRADRLRDRRGARLVYHHQQTHQGIAAPCRGWQDYRVCALGAKTLTTVIQRTAQTYLNRVAHRHSSSRNAARYKAHSRNHLPQRISQLTISRCLRVERQCTRAIDRKTQPQQLTISQL